MRGHWAVSVLASILILGTLGFSQAQAPSFVEQAKLTALDAAAGDSFGVRVSISGDTAVVGAPGDDDGGDLSGSAYVFTRSGTTWTEQAKLTASDAAAGDGFGNTVAVSGDTAVVGAINDDDAGDRSGSAYVFVRSGTTWTQQAKLTASDAAAFDLFGREVAVSGDTTVITAASDDDGGLQSGSAYVFVRSGTTWTQQAKLTASDAAADDQFGNAVTVSGDTVIVGAAVDDNAGGSNSGAAYVFVRSGTTWSQQAKLTASDPRTSDRFGFSVTVSGDTAVVGAIFNGNLASNGFEGDRTGAAYVLVRSGTTWTQQAKITASDGVPDDRFGSFGSAAISGDTVAIGATKDGDAGSNSGSAYVFTRSGTTWTEQAKLTASDAAAGDIFGISVGVSGDTVAVGASEDGDAGSNSGSAYIFNLALQTTTVNFDSVDTSGGLVSGTAVDTYLAGFGITVTDEGSITTDFTIFSHDNDVRVFPTSSPNAFYRSFGNEPYSYSLNFATPLDRFDFTRSAYDTAPSGIAVSPWNAQAFDSNGGSLGTVGEGQQSFFSSNPPVSFSFTGPDIAKVTFFRDSQNTFSGIAQVPLDDLILTVPDSTIPAAPIITSPTEGSIVPNLITVTGTAEPNAAIEVLASGGFSSTTTADSNGNWSVNVIIGISGVFTLTATQTTSGGTSAVSTGITVTIQPPPPIITSPANNARLLAEPFTVTGTSFGFATIDLFRFDTTLISTTTADSSGNWSANVPTLPIQLHPLTATQTENGVTSAASEKILMFLKSKY